MTNLSKGNKLDSVHLKKNIYLLDEYVIFILYVQNAVPLYERTRFIYTFDAPSFHISATVVADGSRFYIYFYTNKPIVISQSEYADSLIRLKNYLFKT